MKADPFPTRARPETLFAVARPDLDPEGVVSRFTAFEFLRHRRDRAFVLSGSLAERLGALHWYLCDYGRTRDRQIPLSKTQLAFLNRTMPVIGAPIELSIAAYSFITHEFANTLRPDDEDGWRAALYWWATQRSIDFAPDGELVTPAQIRALKAVGPEDRGRNFPLNAFVRRTHALDRSLGCLNLDLATDRALLVAILMLRCADRPFLSSFLPDASVASLLCAEVGGREGESVFERLLAFADGDPATPASAGQAARLRNALEESLRHTGRAFARLDQGAPPVATDIGACQRPDHAIQAGLDAGVAVIGPVRAMSGLGQAARLSIDLLERAGYAPAVVEFGMDNPAPTLSLDRSCGSRLQVPRQINLFHLNAEFVPLAFAYLDRALYERSYNIGYVFWELDRIPHCHGLALDMLDEIWVASEYNRAIYADVAAIPVQKVGMAVAPLPPFQPVPRARFGLTEGTFIFLATFDSFSFVERKNPLGTIAAFQAAFPPGVQEDVALVLKTQNRSRVGDPHQQRVWARIDAIAALDPRIRIVDRTLDYGDLLGFTRACDCYVSLHRSEGWGFGLIEAMQLRLPVVATAYSGSMEFCSPETAFLVDFDLVAVMPDEYIHVERGSRWAEPSIASAAAAMRTVRGNPILARKRAEEAFGRVQRDFSLDAVALRYRDRIEQIRGICAEPKRSSVRSAPDRTFRLPLPSAGRAATGTCSG